MNLSKHLSRSQKTLIAVVSDHVQRHTGLDARKLCAGSVELAIRRRLARLGIEGLDRYTQLLLSEPPELRELVEELVVRETWFFRESETLDAVASLWRTWATEGLARRPFRVLSAPCSTGEEAYSVAMRLIEAGALQEQIAVEGLDISESALLQAKEGVYEQYSLRGVVPSRRERFFFKEGNSFRLRDDVLRSVRFRVGNLNLISDLAGLGPFDVILCRNLLIYMDHPARARVLGALGGLLSPAGWLFLGAAEAPRHAGRQFVTRGIGTVRAFQPRDEERADPAAPAPVQGLGESRAPVRAAPVEAPSDQDMLGRIRSLADRGLLEEARKECDRVLRVRECCPETNYLNGLVRDAMGFSEEAIEFYRRAIYLAPAHYESLIHLALLKEQAGDLAEARSLQERATRVLKERNSLQP